MARKIVAYAWRGGIIEFGASVPKGAIEIALAFEARLRNVICAVARHAYDGKTLLVPGIPEAVSDDEAANALDRFRDQVIRRLN